MTESVDPTQDTEEEYFFLREQEGSSFVLASQEEDPFYLANKTFYTTCHKISRQNNPNFRKKPPYTFLENWLIHSVFSKSQQILLRFPVIHPKVMMTEGDFIYTPHQMASNTNPSEEADDSGGYYEDEDDEYYDDDTFIIGDEGVIMMSASAPEYMDEEESVRSAALVMDENTWMGHSKYNGNGLTLHVVNPDLDEEDKMIEKKKAFQNDLPIVKEEEEDEEDCTFISMSPEILNWYRSADLKSMKSAISEDEQENMDGGSSENISRCMSESNYTHKSNSDESEKNLSRHSSESYQSLADMMEEETGNHPIYSQQITTTSYGTLLAPEQTKIPPIMRVSNNFVDATWKAIDIAQAYHESDIEKNFPNLVSCVFKIWKILILGAGSMLDWRSRIKLQTII